MSSYLVTKSSGVAGTDRSAPTKEDMALISNYTRKIPDEKDLYIFCVTLCDNEVDRDMERFSLEAINTLKDMFEGVTGIFDHSMKSSDQTARIFRTEVVTDNSKITSCGEPYTRLKAWCYMLRNEKNSDLIAEIDAGIKKEVSISCSVKTRICSVCGKNMRTYDCPHTQGENLDGKICHAILSQPTDAYEWSFVAVPAQRNAGVSKGVKVTEGPNFINACDVSEIIKAITENVPENGVSLSSSQLKSLAGYIAQTQEDAQKGKEQRADAEKEVIALCAFTLPDADTQMLPAILKKLTLSEVFMLKKAFTDKATRTQAFTPVFRSENVKCFSDNSQFKI